MSWFSISSFVYTGRRLALPVENDTIRNSEHENTVMACKNIKVAGSSRSANQLGYYKMALVPFLRRYFPLYGQVNYYIKERKNYLQWLKAETVN